MTEAETRSKKAFAAAPEPVQRLIRDILKDERIVQHQKRRVLPDGRGIHDALLKHVKEAVR